MLDLFTMQVGEEEVLMIRCHWCGDTLPASDKKLKHWATLFGRLYFCFVCTRDFVHKHGPVKGA